jgi:hypothetical protein
VAQYEKDRSGKKGTGRNFKLRAAKRQHCPTFNTICHEPPCDKSRSRRQTLNRGNDEEAGNWKKTGTAFLVRRRKQRFEKKRHGV